LQPWLLFVDPALGPKAPSHHLIHRIRPLTLNQAPEQKLGNMQIVQVASLGNCACSADGRDGTGSPAIDLWLPASRVFKTTDNFDQTRLFRTSPEPSHEYGQMWGLFGANARSRRHPMTSTLRNRGSPSLVVNIDTVWTRCRIFIAFLILQSLVAHFQGPGILRVSQSCSHSRLQQILRMVPKTRIDNPTFMTLTPSHQRLRLQDGRTG
jgi:hypothetical protein